MELYSPQEGILWPCVGAFEAEKLKAPPVWVLGMMEEEMVLLYLRLTWGGCSLLPSSPVPLNADLELLPMLCHHLG